MIMAPSLGAFYHYFFPLVNDSIEMQLSTSSDWFIYGIKLTTQTIQLTFNKITASNQTTL